MCYWVLSGRMNLGPKGSWLETEFEKEGTCRDKGLNCPSHPSRHILESYPYFVSHESVAIS